MFSTCGNVCEGCRGNYDPYRDDLEGADDSPGWRLTTARAGGTSPSSTSPSARLQGRLAGCRRARVNHPGPSPVTTWWTSSAARAVGDDLVDQLGRGG